MRAIWQGTVIADSEDTVVVAGSHYFPLADVAVEYLEATDTTSESPVLGTAVHFSIVVADMVNPDAAWTYPKPGPEGREVLDRVAFAPSVSIEESAPVEDAGQAAAAELADEIESIQRTEGL